MLSMGPRENVLCVGPSVETVSAPRFSQKFDLVRYCAVMCVALLVATTALEPQKPAMNTIALTQNSKTENEEDGFDFYCIVMLL